MPNQPAPARPPGHEVEAPLLSPSRRPRGATPRDGARIVLAGAAINNDNRGVEALGASVIARMSTSTARISVLDDGWGVRAHSPRSDRHGLVELVGVRNSRRWYRRESWARIRVDQMLGATANPAVARLTEADAVVDLSGGDSFTDLYGPQRLATVCAPKEAALRAGRPLVLLPQTFGPFTTAAGRRRAERLVRSAALVYSRDSWSHEQLLDLAGPGAGSSNVREGVDVAFALPAREPDPLVAARFHALDGELVVGVNVSGLLRNAEDGRRFGLAGDYLATATALVRALVTAGAVVVLVPHVHGERGPGENDAVAIDHVRAALGDRQRERVWALPPQLRAAELKWCIARTEWFVGTRMHATIAALSSTVPTFGYAYSDKASGVFGTCGVADQVGDARTVAGDEAVAMAMASLASRERTRLTLQSRVPAVVTSAHRQLDDVLAAVAGWQGSPGSVRSVA